MIATYNEGEDRGGLPSKLFPTRVVFDVADPPQAEERVTHEQAHPSALLCAEDWWWLPPSNVLLHAPTWTFEQVVAYSRATAEVVRFHTPDWLLNKWAQRPWWMTL